MNRGKESYKISVIVPIYNSKEYLKRCIDSILQQSYHNLELLLIDDASTDGSGEICEEYATQDMRVHVIHRKNGGCTAASLTGLGAACGEYIMFVDGDDYIDTETLEEMARYLIGKKGEIICCNHVIEKGKRQTPMICPAKPGVYEGKKLQTKIKDRLLGNEQRTITISRCMKLYEKSVFEGNEKYCDTRIHMGEDFNLVYPALLDCTRLVVMENSLFYHYCFVEGSMVHIYDPRILDSVERVRKLWYRVRKGKGIEGNVEALNREYCYMLILVMKNELRNPDRDYVEKIQEIFTKPKIHRMIVNTPVSVKERSNVLLYLGMRFPRKPLLWILRRIIQKYDRQHHGG